MPEYNITWFVRVGVSNLMTCNFVSTCDTIPNSFDINFDKRDHYSKICFQSYSFKTYHHK